MTTQDRDTELRDFVRELCDLLGINWEPLTIAPLGEILTAAQARLRNTPDTGKRAITLPEDAGEQIVNLACEFETNELSTYTLRVNAARLVDLWSATPAPAPATERAGGYALGSPGAAREAGRAGWNIRCNHCGGYGARWMPGERPGWHFGNLALCDLHADELEAEYRRHGAALAVLREVRYEQEAEAL